MLRIAASGMWLTLMPGMLRAHASEQGYVLLLPTDIYIAAGGAVVALTIALLAVLPGGLAASAFRPVALFRVRARRRQAASLMSALLLVWLLWRGLDGPRDPAVNPDRKSVV